MLNASNHSMRTWAIYGCALALVMGAVAWLYCDVWLPFSRDADDKSVYAAIQKVEYYNRKMDGQQAIFSDSASGINVLSAETSEKDANYGLWIAINRHCKNENICYIGDINKISITCEYVNQLFLKHHVDSHVRFYLQKHCK